MVRDLIHDTSPLYLTKLFVAKIVNLKNLILEILNLNRTIDSVICLTSG